MFNVSAKQSCCNCLFLIYLFSAECRAEALHAFVLKGKAINYFPSIYPLCTSIYRTQYIHYVTIWNKYTCVLYIYNYRPLQYIFIRMSQFFRKCSLTLLKIFFGLLVGLHVPYGNFLKFGKSLEISEDICPFETRFYELIAELMRQIWYS